MRRLLRPLTVVVAVVAVAASACGVAADTTAASFRGDTIVTTTDVDQLAADAAFVQALTGTGVARQACGRDCSTVPGNTAREVLLFETQRRVLESEAERWGVQVSAQDRAQARRSVQQQLAGGGSAPRRVTDRITDYVATLGALTNRLREVDASSEQDLRALYDGAPSLWEFACMTVVQVPARGVDRAAALVDRGSGTAVVAKRVRGAQVVATSRTCLNPAALPQSLRDAVRTTRVGTVRTVTTEDGTGFVFRVRSYRTDGFRAAQGQLRRLARAVVAQGVAQWLPFVMLGQVEINPRYGQDIVVAGSGLVIAPPQAPPVVATVPALPAA